MLDRLLAGWSVRVARSPRLRAAFPLWVEDFARRHLLPRLEKGPAARLEDRLWGGYSRAALRDLAALAEAGPPAEAAAAALALARWHGAEGEDAAALALARAARARDPALARDRGAVLLEALLLVRAGRRAEARALIDDRIRGFDVSARLLRASTLEDDPARLDAVNAVLGHFGLAGLARRDPAAPLGLDNLQGLAAAGAPGPLVTVIVPVRNAEATLATALQSLAEQTHPTLEVLVVDDASTDASAGVAAGFARADPRFRLIRQEVNTGSYAARNRALAEARGAFVTVQDADDWSHPERIARHLADLLRRDAPFNLSDWARATPELDFCGPWRPSPNLTGPNFSALFFRRELVGTCGPWDTARVSADREFATRLERLLGLGPQRPILPGAPLAFGRSAPGSLTRSGATHVLSIYHGLRREYREAAALWHQDLDPRAVRRDGWRARPPYFPAPPVLRSEPEPAHDLLFIGDFNFRGGAQKSALAMIAAARAAGLRASALHCRRYDQEVTEPLEPAVRRRLNELSVRVVAPGEGLRAETVIVTYPPIFAEAMDRFPLVEHDRLAVVVNQLAVRDRAGRIEAYDPLRVRAHLTELLGGEGVWIPISARVRAAMAADPRYPPAFADTWTPLLDPAAPGPAAQATWRGAGRPRPVIGRHGRDDPLKWPLDPAVIAAAYCAGRDCELRILGGAHYARTRLRPWPANWRVLPFGALTVPDFLAGLDVFLHYPETDYVEEFGRSPMEAMAAGVPVILPPDFAPTFGAAALYAPPEGVWGLVSRLWRDRELWEARAAAGRTFVTANCDPAAFPARLARLAAGGARGAGKDGVSPPAISVVVPVHGQWDLVPGLLAALAAQSLPAERFEVVIADNEAPEPPPRLPLAGNARLVPAPGSGSYAARNAGAADVLEREPGGLLVFTDADCLPDPGWLAALLAAADAHPGALLAGPVRMAAPADPNVFALYDLVRGIPQARYVARGYAATANLAVPAAVFAALGGFDPARRSGGDAAFCRRAGAAGHPLRLVPEAAVAHPCRSDWASLATKARRIKGGQLTAGPSPRRIAWGLRTLCPPVTDTRVFLAAPHPWRHRLLAVAVRFRLWGVELAEAGRLALGGPPERR